MVGRQGMKNTTDSQKSMLHIFTIRMYMYVYINKYIHIFIYGLAYPPKDLRLFTKIYMI